MKLNGKTRFLITFILLMSLFNIPSGAQNTSKKHHRCQHLKQASWNLAQKSASENSLTAVTRSDTIDITNYTLNLNITDFV